MATMNERAARGVERERQLAVRDALHVHRWRTPALRLPPVEAPPMNVIIPARTWVERKTKLNPNGTAKEA